MNFESIEFKRLFALNPYKSLRLKLGEMSLGKDFVVGPNGDPYPLLSKSEDCDESLLRHAYCVTRGMAKRFLCRFFPYASYELTASLACGSAGFCFTLPDADEVTVSLTQDTLLFCSGDREERYPLPEWKEQNAAMTVSCRPGAFDVYFSNRGHLEHFRSFSLPSFADSHRYDRFRQGTVAVCLADGATLYAASAFIDSGISIADPRTIRYENGEPMYEGGKIYLTASIRLQAGSMQGVFSWIPGTAEFELVGAIYYDSGDGKWCRDVAASLLYHREKKRWYLWVCSFAHNHILGCADFEGDPRFGINVIDIHLMNPAKEGDTFTDFVGFAGDEDPDFFWDAEIQKWRMAICRIDPETKRYRYVFFESDQPFSGYRYVGQGLPGAETGGSFVKLDGELYFLCGNDFRAISDYRIYSKDGMVNAKFDLPDGGFRGWGTLIPVRMGSRTRLYWITFDRHRGSDYTWSYGNLYCFEEMI